MAKVERTAVSAAQRGTFEPLVALLQQELAAAGIDHARPRTRSPRQFTRYYLAVVQLLEAHVAASDAHPPMSRTEVELLCRCALTAATLGEAIELCIRFSAMVHPRAGRPALVAAGDDAVFTLDSLRGATSTAASLVDITGLLAFHQLFQWLVGRDIPLRRVGIGPIQRDDVLAFLKLFRAPVLAGGDSYALVFGSSLLALPVVRDSREFAHFFEVFPCNVFERERTALPEQVLALLHAAVRRGDGLPAQGELARTLEIPLSTFRRRLQAAGTPFRRLREQCLLDAAKEMLAAESVAISEIAARLGFSDPSAFRRAFRQWTGVSPADWRRQR